jgi:hypothetical protein
VNQKHVPDGQSAGNDRLLEVLRGPAFSGLRFRVRIRAIGFSGHGCGLGAGGQYAVSASDRSLCSKTSSIGDDPFFRSTENLTNVCYLTMVPFASGRGRSPVD